MTSHDNAAKTPEPSPALSLVLLGGFAVHARGVPLRKLRTRQGERLLALLALRHDREHDRAYLATRLWPDSATQTAALALLRRALTDLRAALGAEGARLLSPAPSTLRLDLSGDVFFDVREFDRAIASGTRESLDRAIALYHGPLLPGLEGTFDPDGLIQTERERRHRAFLEVLEKRAAYLRQSGQAEREIADLRRLLTADPLRESASRALMLCFIEQGKRGDALAEYQRIERRLADDLNAKPEAQTRALLERLQTPPAPIAHAPDAPLHNVPLSVTSFVGREREVADVCSLLQTTRLLTLTGAGGAGKTRLSLRVCAEVLPKFPDGAWQVELAALSDPSQVTQAVASVLYVRESPHMTLEQAIVGSLSTKRLLLVLDNAEHLLKACAHLASAILRTCPHVAVLVTSREPLGSAGELTYRVPSLSLPDGKQAQAATPDSLGEFESVRLFVERARFAKPDFALNPSNAASVALLCRRLDGIPLALEMAAARTRSLSLEDITERLQGRFRLLTSSDNSYLPRQKTLRALMDWSFGLLDPAEKTLFCRLSVFAGGWTLGAAERVCGFAPLDTQDVAEMLTRLLDKSLVQTDEGPETTRYRLLETMRQYGIEKWAEGDGASDKAEVQQRHLAWCVALAEEAEPNLKGPEQAAWLNRLEREHDNLREALRDCCAPETSLAGLRLAGALWRFWQMRGYPGEGRGYLNRVLTGWQAVAQTGSEAKRVVARALGASGILTSSQGDYETSRALQEESRTLYAEIGDTRGVAETLISLGLVCYSLGDGTAAWSLLMQSLALNHALGDKANIARALNNLGIVAAYCQSDFRAAREMYNESLSLFQELGDKRGIANTLNSLGSLALKEGDVSGAESLLPEGLRRYSEIGDMRGVAYGLEAMALLRFHQGSGYESAVLWASVHALRQSLGTPLPHAEQQKQEEARARGRAALGETAWARAWAQGGAMGWEEALRYALGSV